MYTVCVAMKDKRSCRCIESALIQLAISYVAACYLFAHGASTVQSGPNIIVLSVDKGLLFVATKTSSMLATTRVPRVIVTGTHTTESISDGLYSGH